MILPIRIKTNPTNRTSDPDAKMLCLSKLQISMNMPPILMLYPDNLQKPGHITDARLAALKGIVSSESVSLRSPVSFRALHRGHSVKSAGRFSKRMMLNDSFGHFSHVAQQCQTLLAASYRNSITGPFLGCYIVRLNWPYLCRAGNLPRPRPKCFGHKKINRVSFLSKVVFFSTVRIKQAIPSRTPVAPQSAQ